MKILDVIYNRFGYPELRLLENGRFVTFGGKSAGFLRRESIYDYRGRHLGWFENGVLRDHWGNVIGFGESPSDYPSPIFPIKAIKPIASIVEIEQIRPIPQIPPIKPIKSFNWSVFTPISLFFGK